MWKQYVILRLHFTSHKFFNPRPIWCLFWNQRYLCVCVCVCEQHVN